MARLVATLGKYVFTVGSDDTIFVHLYIACSAELHLSRGRSVTVVLTGGGPWEGGATIRIAGPIPNGVRFSLRRPLGATDFQVRRCVLICHSRSLISVCMSGLCQRRTSRLSIRR